MQTCSNVALREASTGLLWKLGHTDIPNKQDSCTDQTDEQKHILLSYHRSDQRKVTQIRDRIIASGFIVWRNNDQDNTDGRCCQTLFCE